MKVKAKVPINGTEQEIEFDLNPAAYNLLTKDEVGTGYMPKESFEAELGRRMKGRVTLDDLVSNAELRSQAFEKLGVKVNSDGKPQLTADQLASAQQEWETKHLKPVSTAKDQAEARAAKLLDRILEAAIVQAAAEAGVYKNLITPATDGGKPPIVAMLRDTFAYSDEHDAHFVRKGDGFEFASNPKESGKPYRGVREHVLEWSRQKDNPFIDAKKPGGAGLGQPGGGQGGTVTIQREPGRPVTLQELDAAYKQAGDSGRVVVQTPGQQ